VRRGRSAAPALIDDDGFGEAILRAHAIFAPEELEEAEAALEFMHARGFVRVEAAWGAMGCGFGFSGRGHGVRLRVAWARHRSGSNRSPLSREYLDSAYTMYIR
jgi:hypothetical protein